MPTTSLTTKDQVVQLLSDLYGLDVSEIEPSTPRIYSIAEYLNEESKAVGYIACDLETGCRLGAALTQIPAGRVEEAVKDGAMPDSIMENLHEVLNICVNLLTATGGGRVLLGRCLLYTSPSPRDQRGSRMPSSA